MYIVCIEIVYYAKNISTHYIENISFLKIYRTKELKLLTIGWLTYQYMIEPLIFMRSSTILKF